MDFLISTLYMIPGLLLGFSIHEYAHAYVAYKCGDDSQLSLGRLTMNPIKHIDIIGFISILLFGFGWAKPVMINPRKLNNPRQDEFLISISGPMANFIISFIMSGILFIMYHLNISTLIESEFFITLFKIIYNACRLNLMLAFFNLLPIPGFDGYNAILSFLPYRITEKLYFLGKFSTIIFILFVFSGLPSIILSNLINSSYSFFLNFYNIIYKFIISLF